MSESVLNAFLNACRVYDGGEPADGLIGPTQEFIQLAQTDQTMLNKAADEFHSLPPAGVAWILVTFGGLAESSETTDVTFDAVWNEFLAWLPNLPKVEEEDGEESEPPEITAEEQEWLDPFPMICQSVVSHLARSPERHAELRTDAALMERLSELRYWSHGAIWVEEALQRISGPLIVLHPESGKGFRLRFENVANCFHLFTLIQNALENKLPGARTPDPHVVAVARGQISDVAYDEAWWHYGNPHSPTPNLMASIWGEGVVDDIPIINGVRCILLWSMIMGSRGWDGNFFGPAIQSMPSDVTIEAELTKEECQEWFQQLKIDPKTSS